MNPTNIDPFTPTRRPGGPRLTAVGLTTIRRGGVRTLDDINLVIEAGCLTAVIGASGAGKTTLLAALAGVVPAQQGTVTIHGHRMDRHRIGCGSERASLARSSPRPASASSTSQPRDSTPPPPTRS